MKLGWIAAAGIACCSWAMAGEIKDRYESIEKHGLPVPTTLPAVAVGEDKGASIREIGIERADTFAQHGGYSIILKQNGTFTYEYQADDDKLQRRTGQAGANEFVELANYLAGTGFMELEKSYQSNATDQDTHYAMVVTDNGTKIVKDYGQAAPVSLWAIEYILRGIVLTKDMSDPPAPDASRHPPSHAARGQRGRVLSTAIV